VLFLLKRKLGRTGLEVSVVGFGGTWISQLSNVEASKVIRRALDLGITYFDTAKLDGDSEQKIGEALRENRDDCVIATKTGSRTRCESLDDLKQSLQRLQTDRLDIIQLHGIDDEQSLEKAMGEEGVLQMCKKARREGLVDFVGITSHKPRVLVKAIETNEFDVVMVPLNVVTRQALEELVPFAEEKGTGVVVMKPLSAKTSKLITCLYEPSLSLVSQEPELQSLLGCDADLMVRSALRFILAQNVSVVIPGLKSMREVEVVAQVGNDFEGLTEEEKSRFSVSFGEDYCRDCGLCLVCPEGIDIASVLRFRTLAKSYGLEAWAGKLYRGLETKADMCRGCGLCSPKCPYQLPIVRLLKESEKEFASH
jgi:predicted aldo/keto reductase-like oxidoreductase